MQVHDDEGIIGAFATAMEGRGSEERNSKGCSDGKQDGRETREREEECLRKC